MRTLPVGKAQDEAARLKALTNQGIDPRQQVAEQRNKVEAAQAKAKSKAALVGDAWAAYLAQAGGEKKKRGNGLTRPGVLYPLLKMRMVDITAAALKEWQKTEAETRANNARQGFEIFRAFWRWCASRPKYAGVIDTQTVESKDLRDEVPSCKSKKFDVLQRAHLPTWFAAVRSLGNPVMSAYLQALLLTGARREEMAGLRW